MKNIRGCGMTEKRFKVIETITYDDRRVYELTKNDIGYYNFKGEKLLAHMICNELNMLLEENEQLKQLLKSINGSFTFDDNYVSWFEDCVIVSKEGLKEISLGSDLE